MTHESTDDVSVTTDAEFAEQLTTLVRSARESGVATEGVWTAPPFVVVVTPDTVHVTHSDDLPE
jgi:hypothetical protein